MEDTKAMTTEYRMGQWAEIMRRRAESGLSIESYCRREGMPANRYHYWQRRLRAAAAKELLTDKAETTVPVPAGWTQVKIAETKTTADSGVSIEIGKCRVTVENTANMEMLTKVCKALASIC